MTAPRGSAALDASVGPSRGRKAAGLALGTAVFVVLLVLPPPEGLALAPWRVAAVAALLAIFWLTEAVPLSATALLPIVLFPTLGVMPVAAAAAPYADPIVFLFLGGFLIALAIERWNLHRRMALNVLARGGSREDLQIAGFMIATAALSMWVSNTATTALMLPVALSVVPRPVAGASDAASRGFATALMLSIAYAASAGGIATLIGTPPNAFLAAFLRETYGIELGFAQWMLLGVPLSLVMLVATWFLLTRVLFQVGLDTQSWAVYGEASWDFRDSGLPFRLHGGLRYTEDDKDVDEYQIIPEFGLNLAGGMGNTWDEVSGKLGIDWFVNDDIMVYASFSHGYKGGGYSIGQFDEFDPETVDNLEVGIKTQFADGRAQVNAAAFYNDYQDLQVNYLVGTLYLTYNAAEATIQGIEIESTLLVTDQVTIGANFTWLDAEFDSYIFDPGPPVVDLAGDTLNRAPEFTVALTGQYDFSIDGIGNFTARIDYYWQDDVYYRLQNIPRHRADEFDTVDLRFIWTSLDERWTVDAFMKNAGDEDNQRSLTVNDGLSSGSASFVSYYPPKTYGVRLGYTFGQ
jgi:hypothetical protein